MGTQYDQNFFSTQSAWSFPSASAVVPIVSELVPIKSVCDVGCGIGTWLRVWKELGLEDIYGIDGGYVDRAQLMIDPSDFHAHDLTQRVSIDRQFDLAMSTEVAEHLPPERASSFVEDLTKLAPLVLFSAAIPMQGGVNHINEQWQDFWAEIFSRYNFEVFDVLRPRIWNDHRVARWYRQNAFLYCRRDSIHRFPRLASATSKLPLSVVHPKQYIDSRNEIDTRTALRLTGKAVARAIKRRLGRLGNPNSKEARRRP
jgi:SAM-dependent methyltransferase